MRNVLKKLCKRILILLGLVFATATMTFILIELSPIDPVNAYLGADVMSISAEQRDLIIKKWGFDQPAPVRYFRWMNNLLHFDLGISTTFEKPVTEVIWSRFQISFALMIAAWLGSALLGYLLGIIAGVHPEGVFDKTIKTITFLISSIPSFYIGIIFLILFAINLKVFPICCAYPIAYTDISEASLFERINHLILPALTLSFIGIPQVLMQTREKTIEIMESDYVALAKVNKKSQRQIIFSHVLKNVSLPSITLLFANFVEIFGGSVLVEQVFSYPGLGRATVMAGLKADMSLLSGIAIFSVVFVYIGNSIADILIEKIDPRIIEKQGV